MTALDLGIASTPEEAVELLTDAFADFFRTGGSIGWTEWVGMIQTTRDAAVAAGLLVQQERSQQLVDEIVLTLNASNKAATADDLFDEVEGLL